MNKKNLTFHKCKKVFDQISLYRATSHLCLESRQFIKYINYCGPEHLKSIYCYQILNKHFLLENNFFFISSKQKYHGKFIVFKRRAK